MNTYEVFINENLTFQFEGVRDVHYTENVMYLSDNDSNILAAFDITNVVMVHKIN